MRRGFTLIELLAVIVILAIIAVIATPIVINIINDAKNNSLKRSAENYVKAIEQSVTKNYFDNTNQNLKDGRYYINSDGNFCLGTFSNNICSGEIIKVEVDSSIFSGGFIDIVDKEVIYYDLLINNENVSKIEYTPDECFQTADIYGRVMITKFLCAPYIYDSTTKGGIENINQINNITEVVIPSKINGKLVISIGANAFAYNGLNTVILPNTLTGGWGYISIGAGAFQNNNLTNIIIPSSVTSIGGCAFFNNPLTSVIIKGKSSISDFVSYPTDSWYKPFNEDNIVWEP